MVAPSLAHGDGGGDDAAWLVACVALIVLACVAGALVLFCAASGERAPPMLVRVREHEHAS